MSLSTGVLCCSSVLVPVSLSEVPLSLIDVFDDWYANLFNDCMEEIKNRMSKGKEERCQSANIEKTC